MVEFIELEHCDQNWEEMTGDDKVRFCEHCHSHVFNMDGMGEIEIVEFIKKYYKIPCLRMVKRRGNFVKLEDCSVETSTLGDPSGSLEKLYAKGPQQLWDELNGRGHDETLRKMIKAMFDLSDKQLSRITR